MQKTNNSKLNTKYFYTFEDIYLLYMLKYA